MTSNNNKQTMDELLTEINQLLHNKGIPKQHRIDYIIKLLNCNNSDGSNIKNLLNRIQRQNNNEEFIQQLFMTLGETVLKTSLDAYYTPIEISKFINLIFELTDKSQIADLCAGTGDLILMLSKGFIDLVDISEEVTKLLQINLNLRNFDKKRYTISTKNSLILDNNNLYNFICLNSPFGKKTIETDSTVLKQYYLSKNLKKMELGKLFIERCLISLQPNGILLAIIPTGYLSNISEKNLRKYIIKNYTIRAIIELPEQTFVRSGTGVGCSIIIIENCKLLNNYDIFIHQCKNLSDLISIIPSFNNFAFNNNITNLVKQETLVKQESRINIEDIKLDKDYKINIKTYTKEYLSIINDIKDGFNLEDYVEKIKKTKIDLEVKKLYLDISEVNRGDYNINNYIMGKNLPNRASYLVEENDILVSKLKGKISFCIICKDYENIIVSNGLFVVRFKKNNEKKMLSLFKYLHNINFVEQLNNLCNGSIMACISQNDFYSKILIPEYNNDELIMIKEYINHLKKINEIKQSICMF
jgi:tRNA1(Val) A37 N6-methylase TrmN6